MLDEDEGVMLGEQEPVLVEGLRSVWWSRCRGGSRVVAVRAGFSRLEGRGGGGGQVVARNGRGSAGYGPVAQPAGAMFSSSPPVMTVISGQAASSAEPTTSKP